jgi:hypothetical protein
MAARYTPLTPLITSLPYADGVERPYTPLFSLVGDNGEPTGRFEPAFVLPVGVTPTAVSLQQLFFPDTLIDSIVRCTNAYAKKNETPARLQAVTKAEILRFLAIYYYMGVVRLPYKRDYWRTGSTFWPVHYPCLQLTRKRFEYVWRFIHLTEVEGADVEEVSVEADDDNDDDAVGDEPIQGVLGNDPVLPDDVQEDDVEVEVDPRWYAKAAPLIDHINMVSRSLCRNPGFACSIDEMMKRFKGRSGQTARMKNKPIKEGYKFFSLCDVATGYVYNFIPDGRLVKRTIADIVLELVESLPRRAVLQYVVGMDNYFTYAKIIKGMRDLGVGCIGTARYKRAWPPKEMRDIKDERFNTLYLMNDEKEFLIGRWIDNNVVTMVSSVHTGQETIQRERKKPRVTATNRNNLTPVWGTEFVRSIKIPGMIDDYNHWMIAVDKSDQLISYYRADLRCRRTWMPLMLHCLDVVRVNALAIARKADGTVNHKDFIVSLVEALLQRAAASQEQSTRSRRFTSQSPRAASAQKKRRTSHTNPKLPEHRLNGAKEDHIAGIDKNKQRACIYCSYLAQLSVSAGVPKDDLPKVRRVSRYCIACRDYMCKDHFTVFHTASSTEV